MSLSSRWPAGVQQTKAISPSQAAAAIEHQRDGSCAALFLLSLPQFDEIRERLTYTCAKNAQNDKTAATATAEMRLCGHTFGVVLLLRLHRRARFFCLVFIDALLKKRNPRRWRRRPRLLSARQPLNIIAGTYLVQREARALIIILVVRRGRCSRADNAANCVWVKCVYVRRWPSL